MEIKQSSDIEMLLAEEEKLILELEYQKEYLETYKESLSYINNKFYHRQLGMNSCLRREIEREAIRSNNLSLESQVRNTMVLGVHKLVDMQVQSIFNIMDKNRSVIHEIEKRICSLEFDLTAVRIKLDNISC